MNFLLLKRTGMNGIAAGVRHGSFFFFLMLSFYLAGTVTLFFDALHTNRGRYFAQRHTGFYSIVKKDCTNMLVISPPREEDLFDPSEVQELLIRLGIPHSVRLRSPATMYLDEPERMELRNPRSIIVIASDPAAEAALLRSLSFKGKLPAPERHEAVLYASAISQEMKQHGIIVQLPSRFGIPISEHFHLSGTFTSEESRMHPPLLFMNRSLFLELTGREENQASSIILDKLSFWQHIRLSLSLPESVKIIPYTAADSIAKAVSLVSITLHLLLLGFIFIVVFSCLLNTLTISVLNRAKEIGILRVFGYGSRTVVMLFCTQYLCMLLPAWAAGSALTAGTAVLLNTLQLSATDINLELVFAGKELIMHPSASVFFLPLCYAGLMTVLITALRTRAFLHETSR
ncbi:MAG: ABC transporter permease [Treponema sp.]